MLGLAVSVGVCSGWRSAADEFLYSGTAFAKPHDRIDMLANITSRNANDIRMGGGETLAAPVVLLCLVLLIGQWPGWTALFGSLADACLQGASPR